MRNARVLKAVVVMRGIAQAGTMLVRAATRLTAQVIQGRLGGVQGCTSRADFPLTCAI
jgi:hypothetical protein